MTAPIPMVDWNQPDETWLAARRRGCGASDVAALLGFDRSRTPWKVWAEKTGHPLWQPEDESRSATLGKLLEPWLHDMARRFVYQDRDERDWFDDPGGARLYSHPEHPWRVASPDGQIWPLVVENGDRAELLEYKSAGIETGRTYGIWTDDSVPLGYELQARWQMHVMDAPICHIVALVVGRGLCHYPIPRDLELEADLVEQVSAWWERHIIGGEEPPLTGRDAAVVAALYPKVVRPSVDLDDTDAMMHWRAYLDARADQTDAEQRKLEAGTALKALIGEAQIGRVEGRQIAAWSERKGRVDWEKIARDLHEVIMTHLAGDLPAADVSRRMVEVPIEDLAEQYRGPTSRAFTIKE